MSSEEKHISNLGLTAAGGQNPVLTGLYVDQRQMQKGGLFAALAGVNTHGAVFAPDAIQRGAAAVLTDPEGGKILKANMPDAGEKIALCVTENPRQALAFCAALFYGPQPKTMMAVTGTNGKTSIATFCRQIWVELGLAAVNLGTTGVEGVWAAPLSHTTPEPITLHKTLAAGAQAGVTHAALEASSHGLHQARLDGVHLAVAGFSNFSQDHLDYHSSFDAYFAAKMELFERVLPTASAAVINTDDPKSALVMDICQRQGHSITTVGRQKGADLHIISQRFDPMGQDIRFEWAGQVHQVHLPLVGAFQGDNVMLAAAMVIAAGANPADVWRSLQAITPVRGRMELAAQRKNGAVVFVDYAHTPDAIEIALKSLRAHCMGRLVAVVGAGGDRDAQKRPLMGAAAARHADMVIVTDDNPRFEDPKRIRKMVMDGAAGAVEVPDRAAAILRGVDALQAGDVLLIAGKGHETGQKIGGDILAFDDVEQASICVEVLDNAAGAQ